MARWSRRPGNGPDLVRSETGLVICRRRSPRLVGCSKRMCLPVECYVEVGRCGERSAKSLAAVYGHGLAPENVPSAQRAPLASQAALSARQQAEAHPIARN
ncbi:hypothetical protein GCM10009579_85250 [Streptomyces javensis]|uniref:Uncharacterized protein n=1 Tax=Streptomyces javensis TaxID=114698 RepID=A0ABP4I3I5_9ACTN